MIYTVTFNPALDYVVRLPKLVTGEVNRTETDSLYFGGKGINVSAVLKELGVESVALGFTAGFTGKALQAALQKAGVKTDFVELDSGNTRINVKIKAETETDINAGGPPISQTAFETLMQKLDALQPNHCLSFGQYSENFARKHLRNHYGTLAKPRYSVRGGCNRRIAVARTAFSTVLD